MRHTWVIGQYTSFVCAVIGVEFEWVPIVVQFARLKMTQLLVLFTNTFINGYFSFKFCYSFDY